VIVVVGLSHRTAPIEVRERFALPDDRVGPFLEGLLRRSEVREAFVVSTCNRVEIVAAGPEATPEALELAARACREALVELGPSIDEYLYAHVGARAVEHPAHRQAGRALRRVFERLAHHLSSTQGYVARGASAPGWRPPPKNL